MPVDTLFLWHVTTVGDHYKLGVQDLTCQSDALLSPNDAVVVAGDDSTGTEQTLIQRSGSPGGGWPGEFPECTIPLGTERRKIRPGFRPVNLAGSLPGAPLAGIR